MSQDRYKLLIVDDEGTVAHVTALALQTVIDADISIVTDPYDAVRLFEEGAEIAVVLSDLKMPGMSGMDLLRYVHTCSPHTVSMLVTAFTSKELLIEVLNEGFVWKCLEKPWEADELTGSVAEALALYHRRVTADESAEAPAGESSEAAAESMPEPALAPKEGVPSRGKILVRRSPRKRRALGRSAGAAVLKRRMTEMGGAIRIKKRAFRAQVRETASVTQLQGAEAVIDTRYQDLTVLGEGGSGMVYKATDTLLSMPVAIKVLIPEIASDEVAVRELFSEARIAMQLSHKHIVRLHNIEQNKGAYYLVMEYIEGSTLREMQHAGEGLDRTTVSQIVEICEDAFGYAHRRHIYHRDIKPENFMVTADGLLKIIDFGLACLAQRASEDGNIHGTPFYMSPEEIHGEMIDQRSDVFSLAVMIHELLTGYLPFPKEADGFDLDVHPPMPSRSLSTPFRKLFARALAIDPAERCPNVHEFAAHYRAAVSEDERT